MLSVLVYICGIVCVLLLLIIVIIIYYCMETCFSTEKLSLTPRIFNVKYRNVVVGGGYVVLINELLKLIK